MGFGKCRPLAAGAKEAKEDTEIREIRGGCALRECWAETEAEENRLSLALARSLLKPARKTPQSSPTQQSTSSSM
jgi:hypothetical protein